MSRSRPLTRRRAQRLACATVNGFLLVCGGASAQTGSGGAMALAPDERAPSGGPAVEASASGGMSAGDPATGQATAPAATSGGVPAEPGAGSSAPAQVPYGALIATTARRHGLSASLLTALVWQESGFQARARSRAGARGLTQLMPATARELGVRRIYDPAQNVDGGARYLKALLTRFGSTTLALAAYNAGPNAVARHRGIPPYGETRRYVRAVLALEARVRAEGTRRTAS